VQHVSSATDPLNSIHLLDAYTGWIAGSAGKMFKRDIAPPAAPSTSATGIPASWSTSPVTFSLETSGGVSPCEAYYSLNGDDPTAYGGPVTIDAEGRTDLSYWSVDALGRTEVPQTTTIRIDTVAPATSISGIPASTGTDPVTFTLVAADATSGVANTYYTLSGPGVAAAGVPNLYTVPVTVSAPGAYTVTYWSTDVAGNTEATRTASFTIAAPTQPTQPTQPKPVPVAKATALKLTSKSNSALGYNKAFKVAGTLKAGSAALSGRQVVLQSAAPGKAFKDTKSKATTNSKGAFSFSVKPKAKTRYRVRFAGAANAFKAATSSAVTATPKVSVSTPKAPTSARRNKSFTVTGTIKPAHTKGSSKVVRIYKYKKVGKKWVSKGYVKAKLSSTTKYKVKVKLTSKGTWRLRAYAPKDSKHAATWSAKYDTVRVK
jgi:hypothetical protein